MSCLMAVRRPGGTYRPYFQNRVGEVQQNLQALAAQVSVIEEPLKIAGTSNPADIGTRGKARLEDIGPGSLWQLGPDFLCRERELWDLEIPEEVAGAVPESEMRQRASVNALEHVQAGRLAEIMGTLLEKKGDVEVVISVLARIMAGLGSSAPGDTQQARDAI